MKKNSMRQRYATVMDMLLTQPPLTGKQLRFAATHGLKVRYVEIYHNPEDKHMNFNADCRMEPAKTGFYIGNSDIEPDDYGDDCPVIGEFPEGIFGVYPAKHRTAKDY